jgi:hypothetical protein
MAKSRQEAGAIFGRIPIGEIEDDAGEEAGLGDAEQEAQDIEARDAADHRHQRRDDTPAHHDAGDPAARAEFLQREVARNLEDEIADEEDAGAPGKDQRREFQVRVHGQRGEAEIDAVEIGEEVGQDQERNQAPGDRADRRSFDLRLVEVLGAAGGTGIGGGLAHGFLPGVVAFFGSAAVFSIESKESMEQALHETQPGTPVAPVRTSLRRATLALAVIVCGLSLRWYGFPLGLPALVVKYGGSLL